MILIFFEWMPPSLLWSYQIIDILTQKHHWENPVADLLSSTCKYILVSFRSRFHWFYTAVILGGFRCQLTDWESLCALVIAFSCAAATKHLYSVVSDCMLPVTLEKLCDKTTEAEKIEPEEPLFHNVLRSSCICQSFLWWCLASCQESTGPSVFTLVENGWRRESRPQ